MASLVSVKIDGPLAFVQLNRPPANAYNLEFLKDLEAAIEELRHRDEAKVVIVQGNERFFSAGADITTFTGAAPEAISTFGL
ncbi:MAG: enoyl-CoA hydratase/isomerase family protein, partial [Chloroflexota bacterium]